MIINDDVHLAKSIGAAGVHLGEDDGDIAAARALLGAQAIIGASCYDELPLAQRAVAAGAVSYTHLHWISHALPAPDCLRFIHEYGLRPTTI